MGIVSIGLRPTALVLSCCWLASIAPTQLLSQTDAEAPGAISGVVLDEATGSPVRNAEVTGRLTGGSPSVKTKTDPEGRFLLRELAPGAYDVYIEHRAYLRLSKHVRTDVQPGETVGDIEIRLMRPGVITGKVVDENGEPLVGARVSAHQLGWMNGKRAALGGPGSETNDLGEFRLHGAEPGEYAISATIRAGSSGNFEWQPALDDPEGARLDMSYVRTFYPSALEWEGALLVRVASGSEVQGIRIDMKPQRRLFVSGQVTGLSKTTMRFAPPQLRRLDSQGPLEDFDLAQWDYNGRFRFQGLSPGRYLLRANVDYPPGVDRKGWLQFEITDRSLEGVELRLQEGIAVPGAIVLDTELEDVALHATIWLRPKDVPDAQVDTAAHPETGRFTLVGVPPWTYVVEASGHHAGGELPPFYMSEVRVRGVPLPEPELTIGETPPQDLEVVLAQSARVSGVVLDENGNPVQDAVVFVASGPDDFALEYSSSRTDQRGGFTRAGFLPGDRVLYALESYDRLADGPDTLKRLLQGKGAKLKVEKAGDHWVELKVVRRD